MDKFMLIFQAVFAFLIGILMIVSGFVLSPTRFDEKPKKAHTKV